jgi:excinuclease Cho
LELKSESTPVSGFVAFDPLLYGNLALLRPRISSVGLLMPPPAVHFVYPTHIDADSLAALPGACGIYIFCDRRGQPLYVGKSVNIRQRVLSHLRTPEESELLMATHRIDFVPTGGEVGALLLESHLIKQWQPPWNRMLTEYGETFSLRFRKIGQARLLDIVGARELPEGKSERRFGLFSSKSHGQRQLAYLMHQQQLCPALSGHEMCIHGRACFAFQLKRCRGVCAGHESIASYDRRVMRLLKKLDRDVWPYAGPIGLLEIGVAEQQMHVISHWMYLGSVENPGEPIVTPTAHRIDVDTYRIVSTALEQGRLTVVPLLAQAA